LCWRVVQRRVGQKQRKHVATVPRHQVLAAYHFLHHAGRLPQHHVATLMPIVSIDLGEVVEIDEDHRAQRRFSLGSRDELFQLRIERATIGKRRQHIGVAENGLHLYGVGLLDNSFFGRLSGHQTRDLASDRQATTYVADGYFTQIALFSSVSGYSLPGTLSHMTSCTPLLRSRFSIPHCQCAL
jgi:hypothetical protein